ncbi:MAG: AAA family ATPase [Bacteroidota bacterium]
MEQQLPNIDFDDPRARNRYLITGGPGFGITTTIKELEALGQNTVKEAARQVIHREISQPDSTVLPWKDRTAFDDAIAKLKVLDYEGTPAMQKVFFDRGLPDLVGWSRYYHKSYRRFIGVMEKHPFNRKVFFTVPWEEIYEQNKERPMPYHESVRVHDQLAKAYEDMGFEIQFLSKVNPKERADFILRQVLV